MNDAQDVEFPRADTLAEELKKTNVGNRADLAKARRRQRKEKQLRDGVDEILKSLIRRMNKMSTKHTKPIMVLENAGSGDLRQIPAYLEGSAAGVLKVLTQTAEESGWHPEIEYDSQKDWSNIIITYER